MAQARRPEAVVPYVEEELPVEEITADGSAIISFLLSACVTYMGARSLAWPALLFSIRAFANHNNRTSDSKMGITAAIFAMINLIAMYSGVQTRRSSK
jgi:Uncharacterised protein family (UPF0139)